MPEKKEPRILILGHAEFSKEILSPTQGEIAHAAKFKELLQKGGYYVDNILDIYGLFGDRKTWADSFCSLAHLNIDLADAKMEIIEETNLEASRDVIKRVAHSSASAMMILSWSWSLAALFATGIQRLFPTISKLYVFHSNEEVLAPLYHPSDLIITECLLANLKGIQYGIPPWKMLYLPHHYKDVPCTHSSSKKEYLERLAKMNGKDIHFDESTLLLATVSRLDCVKNIPETLHAVKRVVDAHPSLSLLFVLKGNFSSAFRFDLDPFLKEPWFLWDSEPTPHAEILDHFSHFDLCLHLSGAEGASNVVVEFLGLGKPVILLEATTNPYLFRGGACFVKSKGQITADPLSYHVPDENDLFENLERLVKDRKAREDLGKKGKEIAKLRFHPRATLERIPLMLEAASAFREKTASVEEIRKKMEKQFEDDLGLYEIQHHHPDRR